MRRARKVNQEIKCHECPSQSDCCQTGAWADLDEAKKILALGLRGEFFQLEPDADFPSGFRIGTSYNDNPCTFLDPDGLCSIHKIDYHLKPRSCREFPYEDDEVSPLVGDICTLFKIKQEGRARRRQK